MLPAHRLNIIRPTFNGRSEMWSGNRACAGPRLQPSVQLRTRDEFEASTGTKAPAGKRYFKHRHLPDIINEYPFRSDLSESEVVTFTVTLCFFRNQR